VAAVQVRKFDRMVSLEELKARKGSDSAIAALQLFSAARLSVQNVTREQWHAILDLEKQAPPG
jgi:predicted RNA-binding protein with PUA-like domain